MKVLVILLSVWWVQVSFAADEPIVGENWWHTLNESKCVGRTTGSDFPEIDLKLMSSDSSTVVYGADLPGGGKVTFSTRRIGFSHSWTVLKVSKDDFSVIEEGGLRLGEKHHVSIKGSISGEKNEFYCYVDVDIRYNDINHIGF